LADTLSLRALLRESGLTDAMAPTLEGLAWYLYTHRGPTPLRGESLPTAYALILERWLLERELNDLVAVLPGTSLCAFGGSALAGPGPRTAQSGQYQGACP